jgi:hypothetical protein
VAAVDTVRTFDRRLVRERFEARFTSFIMTKQYLQAYGRLLEGGPDEKPRVVVDALPNVL